MRAWNRVAGVFYMVVGIAFFYLGVRGGRTDVLRIALGVVFVALGVWRYQRFRRAGAAAPSAPPGGPPRA
jgi:hypothetical protein